LSHSEIAESQQEGLQRSRATRRPVEVTKASEVEGLKKPSSPDVRTFESHLVDERIAALGNWGENAKAKNNSTLSPENYARGWNDLSDFAAFDTSIPWCPLEALGPFAAAFGGAA
jgi:hypothetical protein